MDEATRNIELRTLLRKTLVDAIPELEIGVIGDCMVPHNTLNSLSFVMTYLDEGHELVGDIGALASIHASVIGGVGDITREYPFIKKTPNSLLETERENYSVLVRARDGLEEVGKIVADVLGKKYKA